MCCDSGLEIFEIFAQTCADFPEKIQVWHGVVQDAGEYFGLHSKGELVSFIGNRGLLDVCFLEKKLLDSNKRRDIEIIVFSFEFKAVKKFGYLAFFKSPMKTGCFVIKSFHPSHKQSIGDVSRSPQFVKTLKEIGLSRKGLKRLRGKNEQ